jgi:hypothetical protein
MFLVSKETKEAFMEISRLVFLECERFACFQTLDKKREGALNKPSKI